MDTFELAEGKQLPLMTEENTARVKRQQETPIFVIIGNPPYNAGQVNDNDNNKNRPYPAIDGRVSRTYGRASEATLLRKLNDPYVKAIRWASDRIGEEGIVALVTNNSFVAKNTFDGMRKCLEQDFSKVYHVDLKGDARTSGEQRRREAGNIFDDAIRVGVGITFFVRTKAAMPRCEVYVYSAADYLKSPEKKRLLDEAQDYTHLPFAEVTPDEKHNWLTAGMQREFRLLLPLRARGGEAAVFRDSSPGINTARDASVYNFDKQRLLSNVEEFCDAYDLEVTRYERKGKPANIDAFVDYNKIKWSSTLKNHAKRGTHADFDGARARVSLYRPFSKMFLYYDRVLVERPALFAKVFPGTPD